MSKLKTMLVRSFLMILSIGVCFASTSTFCSFSATYPQDFPPHPVPVNDSMTDPSACRVSGSAAPFIYYGADARASTNAAGGPSGIVNASIYAESLYLEGAGGNYFPPQVQAQASANAEIDAEFTTSGPRRPGVLTFAYSGELQVNTPYIASGSVSISDGIHSYSEEAQYCPFPHVPLFSCPTFSMPIELGTHFHVDLTAAGSFQSNNPGNFTGIDESGTFTLQELDGTPVDAILVTTPEPVTFGLLGTPLLLLLVSGFVRGFRPNGRFFGAVPAGQE